MTKERQFLIDRFQKWLDTNPSDQIIAAQCANIAEEYAEQLQISGASDRRELLLGFWMSLPKTNKNRGVAENYIDNYLKSNNYS